MTEENRNEISKRHSDRSSIKTAALALTPFTVLAGMIAFLFGPGQSMLNNGGAPFPEITIERLEFQQDKVVAFIRNTGPVDVTIAQADINDRILPAAIEPGKGLARLAAAKIVIPFAWNAGEPYEVGITTSDGVRFSKSVESATLAPTPNIGQASFFALIGTYVGIIPVLIGLLWFPFIRRLGINKYNFFLSLTAGLLVFLGIDALVGANGIASENMANAFNPQLLIAMAAIFSFLALQYLAGRLVERARMRQTATTTAASLLPSSETHTQQIVARPVILSLMIAIGIGLHNLGEGLAIGAAMLIGKVALSTFLIVGFMLHNTTEGLAIVASMAKGGKNRVPIWKLAGMGLIAGMPTITGAWIGGFLYSPIATTIFLSIGAGAIFQVVFSIYSWMASSGETKGKRNMLLLSDTHTIAGFAAGMVIMYITGLLVPS